MARVNDISDKLEEFKPKFDKLSKELMALLTEIEPRDLDKDNVKLLADYIDRLASIGAMLKELKEMIDALWKDLDTILGSMGAMELERKLREMIDALNAAKAQNDEIADHIKRIIVLTDSYDGYTSGNEDKGVFTGLNGKSKKLLDELKASSTAMTKMAGDLEKVILVIRGDKKTGDPVKDQAQIDKRKAEVALFEAQVNKLLDGQ